jgi:sodium transport system permease protein
MSSTTFIVFRKELLDMFRDKKTVIIGILIPLIIFPVLFGVVGKSISNTQKSVEQNLKVAVLDPGQSSLGMLIKGQGNVKLVDSTNPEEDIKLGNVLAVIEIQKDFDALVEKEAAADVTIIYDNSSQQSQTAFEILNGFIDAYSKQVVAQRLTKRNVDVDILSPVNIETRTVVKESEGFAKFMLSLMLPMMLILYSVTGPLSAATDLGAGEKERGTLEPLLTTQASRMSLLWGKFFAITLMGLLTSIASIAGLFISMLQKNSLFTMGADGNAASGMRMEPSALILIGIVCLLTTMVFGALELAISIYARSFKEASTYLSPLTIVALVPTYATYMLDAKNIANYYFHIPLANGVCILKELIAGIYDINHLLTTLTWTIIYIVSSILFARFMFSREEVIFRT